MPAILSTTAPPNGQPPSSPVPRAAPEPFMTSVLYVARRWRAVLRWAALGVVLAAAVALLRRPQYLSTASFVTVNRSAIPSGISSLVGNLGLSGLQQDAEGPQFFADLLKTQELLLPILREPIPTGGADVRGKTLIDLYGGTRGELPVREDRALEAVTRKAIATSVTAKTGVVRLFVKTRSPAASQWLAGRLIARLNEFNLDSRRTQAGQERRFAEGVLRLRRDSLRLAEEQLENFVLRNREYGAPSLALTADRLRRETAVQQSLLTSAANMYQEARLREVRDTPALVPLELPRLPARPMPRNVIALAVLGGLLGAALAVVGMLFVRTAHAQAALGDPEAAFLVGTSIPARPGRGHASTAPEGEAVGGGD